MRAQTPKLSESEIVTVRRRQHRAAVTRKKIVAAAADEFSEIGIEGATTRSIAERAGVPHSLVIYHFKTKLGAWQAVLEQAVAEFQNEFEEKIKELGFEDPVATLKESQAHFIRTLAQRPTLIWLISKEGGPESKRLEWFLEKYRDPAIRTSIELIKKAQACGRYIEGDPAQLHYCFVGAVTFAFAHPTEITRTTKTSPFDDAFVERQVDICRRMFFRETTD